MHGIICRVCQCLPNCFFTGVQRQIVANIICNATKKVCVACTHTVHECTCGSSVHARSPCTTRAVFCMVACARLSQCVKNQLYISSICGLCCPAGAWCAMRTTLPRWQRGEVRNRDSAVFLLANTAPHLDSPHPANISE